ncbi:SIS domain-containing protein [Aeromicrobium ponti]|uniref:Galactosamine 6-phosphate isomerase AgaS n=1 Tax=Cytobacillus oceanisediminis TaxID=665099 RepID=A0A562JIR4_9BACI|nr:SIS domain-containing protein [Cytobacillus oceanisediminis]TWH83077.1 galactosamine 6-phosphate isomerase AgaS [Cytobacillus oceanisediminis]
MGFVKSLQEEIKGAKHTVKEILQQPELWLQTVGMIEKQKAAIQDFISQKIFAKQARIIFTGAGTSAYVGDTLTPLLRKELPYQIDSISTTDIVTNPLNYLKAEVPTVLVSFARSGNSPESVATYSLAKKLINNVSQIIITCNPEGQLAKEASKDENTLLLLMPEESNDQGFAMTSSFSCMYLCALLTFQLDQLDELKRKVEVVSKNAERILTNQYKSIKNLVNFNKKRVVYLGSSTLKGLAQEASLKHLELTSGKIPTFHESVLGFRHGPKSLVDDETLIFVFLSNDPYTRKYEIDLLKELKNDAGGKRVVAVVNNNDEEIGEICDCAFIIPEQENIHLEDHLIALNYLIIGQLFALLNSIHLGVTPDNPSPSGMVNRVVKGVNIYNF